jgi:nucleoside-diphosphate-sugar epimerase
MRLLVTGGLGFTGQAVTRLLLSSSPQVAVLSCVDLSDESGADR